MDLCWKVVNEFKDEMACCAVKHSTPCGVAIGTFGSRNIYKNFRCDPVSIFGGIIGMNYKVDAATAEELNKTFLEIVMATRFWWRGSRNFKKEKEFKNYKN